MAKFIAYMEVDDEEVSQALKDIETGRQMIRKGLDRLEELGYVIKRADECESSAPGEKDLRRVPYN